MLLTVVWRAFEAKKVVDINYSVLSFFKLLVTQYGKYVFPHLSENSPHRPVDVHDWMVYVPAGKVRIKSDSANILIQSYITYAL